ncbi:MAG: DUF3683 domain-containing protein [Magnetococcales bacterium]|nr:DUF3683 domain-containing protein [Magnetococcales bacterium]
MTRIREIPYNYTSFSDREIVLRFLGPQAWDQLETLRGHRRTGRSARLLFEVLGDLWMVDRNPFLFEDLARDSRHFFQDIDLRLEQIAARSEGNPLVRELLKQGREAVAALRERLAASPRFRRRARAWFGRVAGPDTVDFSGETRVAHVTDATDWRVACPAVVLTPDREAEVAGLVRACIELGLTIIPRGGGTGYTGGAVPLHPDTAVINMEKLSAIGPVVPRTLPGHAEPVPTLRVEAGAVTKRVAEAAEAAGWVFAVDPTSQHACTIGGNVAMNAGGKKAVRWGTTLDNLLSWRLVTPAGGWLEVTRLDHNLGRIHDLPEARFAVQPLAADGQTPVGEPDLLTIPAAEIRKPGLGKDVTNKVLGGLPGVQKEGCDGLVTSAVFVLHRLPEHRRTLCLEFYGADLARSVPAIVETKTYLDRHPSVICAGLEHMDHRYVKAVGYSPKANRGELPKMVLLADLAGDDATALDQAAAHVVTLTRARDGAGFIAVGAAERERFWADRGRVAAIAAHTNAFKINEDVVIPLERLAEYTRGIERINIEQSIANKRRIVAAVRDFLTGEAFRAQLPAGYPAGGESDTILQDKIQAATALLDRVAVGWQAFQDHPDQPATDPRFGLPPALLEQGLPGESLLDLLLTQRLVVSYRQGVELPLKQIFSGDLWLGVRDRLDAIHAEGRSSRLFVALHMHAGDGNVHTNIPVNSNDYRMLGEAERMVERIMALARELGGVISGEHGIGLTKYRFLAPDQAAAFAAYKARVDPHGHFNRGKLLPGPGLEQAYTPSLRLVQQEALILQESDLGALNDDVRNCLRCGKCKPVCTTHVPGANLLYSPRDKILAVGLLIEAFLYEEQTRRGLSRHHFDSLDDLADHCTICHRCRTPCPVHIDFGQVTMRMREILTRQGKKRRPAGGRLAMAFLTLSDPRLLRLLRRTVIRGGYAGQRWASRLARWARWPDPHRPPPATHGPPGLLPLLADHLRHPLPGPLPARSARTLLGIHQARSVPIIGPPGRSGRDTPTVFYFPGCGAERLFSDITLAVLALLVHHGVRVILPPDSLCCGFPQRAGGDPALGRRLSTANRVLFHRMANTLGYLEVRHVLVSCGTCLEQLEGYDFPRIFPGSRLLDVHQYLVEHLQERFGRTGSAIDDQAEFLFHDPCHSPTRGRSPLAVAEELMETRGLPTDRCCGEAGTFAINRPDIGAQTRFGKARVLAVNRDVLVSPAPTRLLTTCPSCLQGLSRFREELGLEVEFLAVALARRRLGDRWRDTLLQLVREGGMERVIL